MNEQVLAPVVVEPEAFIDPEQEVQNQQALPIAPATRRRQKPRLAVIVGIGLLALVIVAGATRVFMVNNSRSGVYSQYEMLSAPMTTDGDTPGFAAKAPVAADSLASSSTAAGGAAVQNTDQSATSDWDRKIIRNGSISLQVADVDKSQSDVTDIAKAAGGLVFSSDTQYQGDDKVSSMTIQVPVTSFDSVMTSLQRLGVKVLNESSTSQDVTEEYTDLSSQLKNLQTTEDQLRTIMSQAKTVAETLAVQGQLSDVRGQIETIQGRINYLSRRADLSSITISLSPKPLVYTTEDVPQNAAQRAWSASLQMLSVVGDTLITVVVFFWWLIPLLIVGWLLRGRIFARRERAMN